MPRYIYAFFFSISLLTVFPSFAEKAKHIPDRTVSVPMRDGTELPVDLYFPNHTEGKYPCILLRNPAGRHAYPWRQYGELSSQGYVVAIQDTRSALDKEGKSIPYWADGWGREQDGYDTVEWLAKSPFTDGNIGTIGFSALGIVQQMMAPAAPPSLKCQYIGFAAGSIFHHAAFSGGQLLKHQVEGWLGYYAKDPSIYEYMRGQPTYNDFWKCFDTLEVAHRIRVPAIQYGGWYDVFLQGTIDAFGARQEYGGEGAKGRQKLVIGPWVHEWPRTQKLGQFEVPKNAQQMPAEYTPGPWFAHYLKGTENKVEDLPAVTYYVMGPFDGSPSSGNVWRHANKWPIPAVLTSFYLQSNHLLNKEKPQKEVESLSYVSDPTNPVPTKGGRNLFLEAGPMDQREIESRDDVVVFTSDLLSEDTEITGDVFAKIYFSSDQPDTDVGIRLCDVYPDGRSILILDSMHRTGLALCMDNAAQRDLKVPFEVEFDVGTTSIVIAKGHRIRISVSSTNYPRYEVNHHSGIPGKPNQKPISAQNKIYFGADTPSCIILPIVE